MPYPNRRRMMRGLSPRMRGNPLAGVAPVKRTGSIPAYAGEPITHCTHIQSNWVYPRVCGGTGYRIGGQGDCAGLSPRMRGNRRPTPQTRQSNRSIPAYAGEPGAGPHSLPRLTVYPRVCGGTAGRPLPDGHRRGLSPRMRGNRGKALVGAGGVGSIPAYAGEPGGWSRGGAVGQVYPRVCGGTAGGKPWSRNASGLSPRMRGNPAAGVVGIAIARSIPAYAGEPLGCPPIQVVGQVYPRVCGGTAQSPAIRPAG